MTDKSNLSEAVATFLSQQLESWELARVNYAALQNVQIRVLSVKDQEAFLQFNPGRIRSTTAKTDTNSLNARKCFLCPKNQPNEQKHILWDNRYNISINPFPIFNQHLTISDVEHLPQSLTVQRFRDMLNLTDCLTDYLIFYNGPECGASAPDHAHFQAGNRGMLPLERQSKELFDKEKELLKTKDKAALYLLKDYLCPLFQILADDIDDAANLYGWLLNILAKDNQTEEPMMNVICWKEKDYHWIINIFPRRAQRPKCYFLKGDKHILISPATVEMCGFFPIVRPEDFTKVTGNDLLNIYNDVCIPMEELQHLIHCYSQK